MKRVAVCNPASPAAMSGEGGQGGLRDSGTERKRARRLRLGLQPLLAQLIVTGWPRRRLGRRGQGKALEPGRRRGGALMELQGFAMSWDRRSKIREGDDIEKADNEKTGREESSREARIDRAARR